MEKTAKVATSPAPKLGDYALFFLRCSQIPGRKREMRETTHKYRSFTYIYGFVNILAEDGERVICQDYTRCRSARPSYIISQKSFYYS